MGGGRGGGDPCLLRWARLVGMLRLCAGRRLRPLASGPLLWLFRVWGQPLLWLGALALAVKV